MKMLDFQKTGQRKLRQQQQGFTLVEIMLAITLSLILIAGVAQVYLSSKTSFEVQNQLSRVQENQRIAVEFLQRDIRQAGFVQFGQPKIPVNSRIQVTDGGVDANGNPLVDANGNPLSDSIIVRYESNSDCLGQPTGGMAVNRYFIGTDANGISTNQLMCLGNGNVNAQPIADGISNIQILLGRNRVISNDSAQMESADFYVSPVGVTSMADIVSIRIALLVESEQAVRTQTTTQTYTLLDAAITQTNRLKHQVVTTTIPIRNRG